MFAHLTRQGPRAPAGPALGPGSFRRIVDVPFETCVTELDSWQQAEQGGEVRFGDSLLCGPAERDPELGYVPDPGPPGPGCAAPAAAHENRRRPLVLIVHRPRAHPRRARPAHRGLFPRWPSSARLADPPSAAAVASSTGPGYCEPATRACRCRASLVPPRAALAPAR